ncbi:MAG: hypothetical protein WC781_02110 [Candidatus Pacearchaeota archaeon]|jgi:hypothetical protein
MGAKRIDIEGELFEPIREHTNLFYEDVKGIAKAIPFVLVGGYLTVNLILNPFSEGVKKFHDEINRPYNIGYENQPKYHSLGERLRARQLEKESNEEIDEINFLIRQIKITKMEKTDAEFLQYELLPLNLPDKKQKK